MTQLMHNNTKKKLLFWGTGKICQQIIEAYPEIKVEGFLDSDKNKSCYYGLPVEHPDSIADWTQYRIVVTNAEYRTVCEELSQKGLVYGEDYCSYFDFLGLNDYDFESRLNSVSDYMDSHPECEDSLVVFAPFYGARGSAAIREFWKEYALRHTCIGLSYMGMITEEKAEDDLDFHVFSLRYKDYKETVKGDISEAGNEWIKEYVNKYSSRNDKDVFEKHMLDTYVYYEKLIKMIKPIHMVIWGCWGPESLIFEQIAKELRINYRFMEYGWLPGTFHFDAGGFGGQSQFLAKSNNTDTKDDTNIENTVKHVKEYIIKKKLDSGLNTFRESEEDHHSLQKLDKGKKTVFLVGMGEKQMFLNPDSELWRNCISNAYSATREILKDLIYICERHDWNLIFKPHPEEDSITGDNWDEYRGMILVKDKPIDDLIMISDVVVSLLSNVNFKVLLYEKPLVQAGYTLLYHSGCAYDIERREKLEETVIHAMNTGMTDNQKRCFDRFIEYACDTYLWDDMTERSLRYGIPAERDIFYLDNSGKAE